jgi:hypothetical protein
MMAGQSVGDDQSRAERNTLKSWMLIKDRNRVWDVWDDYVRCRDAVAFSQWLADGLGIGGGLVWIGM